MDPLGVMVNYTGQTENGNIPHGFGTGTFLDEAEPYTYMGEWKHGLASGFGQIVYANGDKYTGKMFMILTQIKVFYIINCTNFLNMLRVTRISFFILCIPMEYGLFLVISN